jgi:hypothetical protein
VSHVIEKHEPEILLEGGNEVPPHALVAAEAVRQHHGARAFAEDPHVVALETFHAAIVPGSGR